MALTIEANRFKEMQTAYENLSEESATNKAALLAARDKEEKTATVLTELTSLVKEQKGLSQCVIGMCAMYCMSKNVVLNTG